MAEAPKQAMPARRKARKRALDVLYEADLRDLPALTVLQSYLDRMPSPHPDHMAYAVELVQGVAEHDERIDELIASYSEGWTLNRMPPVDRNLARIAVWELIYADDVDDAVAISEALELAASLSTEDSPRFLNGLLARIAEHTSI